MFFWIALFVFSLLLQYAQLSRPSDVIAASGLKAGTVQGFEVDGDLDSGNGASNPGSIPPELIDSLSNGDDWMDGASGTGVVDPANPPVSFIDEDPINSQTDDVYSGGTKETDTRDWDIISGPKPPAKDDVHYALAYAKYVGNSAFFYAGATRIVNNGDTHIDFELNRLPYKVWADGETKPNRSVGDVLVSLEFSNGGADPIVTVYKVTGVTDYPNGQTTSFSADLATAAAVHSATNFVDLPDQGLGAIPTFEFAETSVDLAALGISTGCPGLSTGHIRTRAGGDLDSSQLKDAIAPFPIDLNNCGKVTIKKNAIPDDAQDFAFTTTGGSSLSDFSLDDDNNATLSDTKVFNDVVPGGYTVTEGNVAGWKLTNLVCDDANGSTDLNARKATLNVGPNEEVTCTFTNTKLGKIIVEKQTLPDGASGSFSFTGDAAGSLSDGQQIVVDNLLPGTYTSTEGDPTPPFDLGSIVCDDANSTGSVGTRTATFRLEAGETVKCTFTNVKRGTINIIKDAIPNDPQDFGFTTTGSGLSPFSLDDDADGTLSNTRQFTNVAPGDFSVTESDVSGWELTGLVCEGTNGSGGTKSGSTANITLTPGGSVTCTFTNTKAGRILVDKVTNPAGDPASFEFDPSYGANFNLTDAAAPNNSGDLKPGTYSVAELAKAGWDLTSATCSDGSPVDAISLQAGETVTCTFTNTKHGNVIVKKVMVGGTDTFSFTGTPNGSIAANNGTISQEVSPGQYVSTETAKAGWDLTSVVCDDTNSVGSVGSSNATFNVAPGETVTCTFTNTKRGHIVVDKVTVPGGDAQLFTFTPSYNGGQTFQLADATAPNDSGALVPGTYSVSESVPAGWDLTSATCSDQSPVDAISLQAGETVTCTFTNTKRGHILIDKVTIPAGDPASFEFDPSYGNNFSLTDASAANDSGALQPGTYSVAELAKSGWDLTGTSCTDQSPVDAISLQPGETVTCTFTNTKRGTIIVEKQTSPDGATGDFVFTGNAAGTISDGEQIVVGNLVPGTYTSTEADPGPGFDLGAIVCDDGSSATPSTASEATRTATFKLDPGETVKCTFTNVQRGTITIIKDAVPNGPQDFGFTTTGSGLSSFSLDDDADATLSNMKAFSNLLAGSYSVTESAVAGWDLTSIDCTVGGGSTFQVNGATANLTLTSGGSITCVYVNQKPSISIVKTAGTAEDGEEFVSPPGLVTYHYHVKNTGPVTLNNVVVTDDNGTPGNASDDFTADCPKTTLAPGEEMDCSKSVQVTSNRTNIGTVTGTSGGGTQVSDTDDAVVRIPSINIDKSADDNLVEPNQTVTFTINVTVANGPVHDATVTDTLPAGQTYVPGTSTVDGAPSEPDVNGQVLTWHLGTVDDEDSPQIVYDVVINGNATTDPQTNVAELCVSELPLCDDDDETVTPQLPDIKIVKTAGDAEDGEVYSTEPGEVTYTYVVTNTGPLPLVNVTVMDDNGTPGDDEDDFPADCEGKTTLAVGESMTCTAKVDVTVDTTNVAVAHGVTPEGNPVEDDDNAIVNILVHGLVIAKSNDAPVETLELPDGTTADLPTADEGETVTYTLAYTFSGDPVSNGILTDVLPVGVTYVDGSATNDAQFTFQSYDAATRKLTWTAATVSASGSVAYKVTIDVGASELEQPLENIATIDSDQTEPDSDTSDVFVPVIPEAETAVPTPPQTDALEAPEGTSGPGSSLMLILAALGGLILVVGLVTPVPAAARRRNRR